MKKIVEKALKAKREQRTVNADRPVAEKMRTLDRMHVRAAQLKRAKAVREGRQ